MCVRPARGSRSPPWTTTTLGPESSAKRGVSSPKILNYRLFAVGAVVSNTGTWFSRIAQDWLVLGLTGSRFAVGVTTAMQFLPVLLIGLYGGVIADRYPRRKLLLATQSTLGPLGLPLAVFTISGQVQVGHATPRTGSSCCCLCRPGTFGLTFNTTANTSIQLAADPAIRGRVMSLFTMVFVGGVPVSGPVTGWGTETYGARVGFLSGGLAAAASAVSIGLILARISARELSGRGAASASQAAGGSAH